MCQTSNVEHLIEYLLDFGNATDTSSSSSSTHQGIVRCVQCVFGGFVGEHKRATDSENEVED